MGAAWTIRSVLDWTGGDFSKRGMASSRLDAELLVAHALGMDRVALYLDLDRPLQTLELSAVRELVARRREHEPVAYILGHRDFYGRRFIVEPTVLIPRPDTETLVDHALDCIERDKAARVIDVGTGSGAIAITIACERTSATVDAVDVSAPALDVAALNADKNGVSDRVKFIESDLFASLPDDGPYDVIVSNPPYVTTDELSTLHADVRKHEPALALDGGPHGLAVIHRLVRGAIPFAAPGARLLFEIGSNQADAVRTFLLDVNGWSLVGIHRDLANIERVVHLSRNRGV